MGVLEGLANGKHEDDGKSDHSMSLEELRLLARKKRGGLEGMPNAKPKDDVKSGHSMSLEELQHYARKRPNKVRWGRG